MHIPVWLGLASKGHNMNINSPLVQARFILFLWEVIGHEGWEILNICMKPHLYSDFSFALVHPHSRFFVYMYMCMYMNALFMCKSVCIWDTSITHKAMVTPVGSLIGLWTRLNLSQNRPCDDRSYFNYLPPLKLLVPSHGIVVILWYIDQRSSDQGYELH